MTVRLALLLLFVTLCASADISFNSTYTTQCGGGCFWNDTSIWVGNQIPATNDTVTIFSDESGNFANIYIDNLTVYLYSLNITGTVNLIVRNNAVVQVPSTTSIITVSDSVTITVDNSLLNIFIITGGTLNLQNGATVEGKIVNSHNFTVDSSNVYNQYVTVGNQINVTGNSYLNSSVTAYYLYYIGNITFTIYPTIMTYGYYYGIPNLRLTNLILFNETQIFIVDCVTTMSTVNMMPNSLLSFSASSPMYTASVGDFLGYGGEIQLGNGMNLTVGGGRGFISAGDGAIINVIGGSLSGSSFSLSFLQTDYAQIFVSGLGQLWISYAGVVNASITTTAGGVVWVMGNITLNSGSNPCIQGQGSVLISGSLGCPGQNMSAGYVELDNYAALNTTSLQVTNLGVYGPSTINGNVTVSQGGCNFKNGPLTVFGSFSQYVGTVNISQGASTLPSPFLQVNGSLLFSTASANVNFFPTDVDSKVLFASASSLIKADLTVVSTSSIVSTSKISTEGDNIYIVFSGKGNKDSFFDKWGIPLIIVGSALGVFAFLGLIIMIVRCKTRRHHYHPVH